MNPYIVLTTGAANAADDMHPIQFKFQPGQVVYFTGNCPIDGWPGTNGARLPTEVPVQIEWKINGRDGTPKYEVRAKIHVFYVHPLTDTPGYVSYQYFSNVRESDLTLASEQRPN